MSYTQTYFDEECKKTLSQFPNMHRSFQLQGAQYYNNLEKCLRKEFDEKIANAVPLELAERIDSLEEENKEIRKEFDQKLNIMENEMKLLKQALADTLAALATK
jgi:predicted patatin/cPLA2 family phospholipase